MAFLFLLEIGGNDNMGRMGGSQNRDSEPEDVSVSLESVWAMMAGTEETGMVESEGNATRSSILYQCGLP